MATEFKLPDLGEGVETGDVVSVLVSVGDTIDVDQGVIELETDKALIEVPSEFAGTIASIDVSEGDSIPPGTLLVTIDVAAGDTEPQAEAEEAPPEPERVAEPERFTEPEPEIVAETVPEAEVTEDAVAEPGQEKELGVVLTTCVNWINTMAGVTE